MIPRHVTDTATRLAQDFPVLTITGPRQSGKTTLARALAARRGYVSLEEPDQREAASIDPRGFLARFPEGAVIDEVQHAPDLMSYLQGWVDARGRMGDFILTGSQQFGIMSRITQSLAGRVGRIELLPFSLPELAAADLVPADLDSLLWRGGYPALYDRPLVPDDWFPSYIATDLERDVRQLLGVRDLMQFQRFVRLCAARTGQLLNLSALGNDMAIKSGATLVRDWLKGIEKWRSFAGDEALPGWLIYGGADGYTREGVEVFPRRAIGAAAGCR